MRKRATYLLLTVLAIVATSLPAHAQDRIPSAGLDGLADAGNNSPSGIWSDGATMWVADAGDERVYAYRLSDGAHQASLEFDLHADNTTPIGIWSDGDTMWVADQAPAGLKVFAYRLSDGARRTSLEFDLHTDNAFPDGIWSDGDTMWVVDADTEDLYAYRLSDGARRTSLEFDLHTDNGHPSGIWSDGDTIWVADDSDERVYAYRLSDGAHQISNGFALHADNAFPDGIWSDGDTMWVADTREDRVFAYSLPLRADTAFAGTVSDQTYADDVPASARPALSDETFTVRQGDHSVRRVTLEPNLSEVTLSLEPSDYAARITAISPADADPDAAGHQVSLTGPLWADDVISVTVAAQDRSAHVVHLFLTSLRCHDGLGYGRLAIDRNACVILDSIIVSVAPGYTVDEAAAQLNARPGWQVISRMHYLGMLGARHVPDNLTLSQLKAQANQIATQPWARRAEPDAFAAAAGIDDIGGEGPAGSGGEGDALSGEFQAFPDSHDGSAAVTGELHFSEDVSIGYRAVRDDVLDVTGGDVTAVRRLDPTSDTPNKGWEITVVPGGDAAVVVALPATTDCAAAGAVCTSGSKMLTGTATLTIAGPAPAPSPAPAPGSAPAPSPPPPPTPALNALPALTATLGGGPNNHDGSAGFTVELSFSEHLPISYRTVRDNLLTVTGGDVTKARRLDPSSDTRNKRWEITVVPDGDAGVVIVLPATTDCGVAGAVCTPDGRKLSGTAPLTIAGPS